MSYYGRDKRQQEPEEDTRFKSEVLYVNRVAKVLKGGRRFRFTALVVVGDGEGLVGMGLGKAPEVVEAIRKGEELARKKLVQVFRAGTTVPFEIKYTYCSTTVLLRPARQGAGITAGGPARPLLTLAGITDCTAKFYGSNNRVNCAKAIFQALQSVEEPSETLKHRRDKSYHVAIAAGVKKIDYEALAAADSESGAPPRKQTGDPRNRRPQGQGGPGGPGRGSRPPTRRPGGGGGRPGGGQGRPAPAPAPAPAASQPVATDTPPTVEGGE